MTLGAVFLTRPVWAGGPDVVYRAEGAECPSEEVFRRDVLARVAADIEVRGRYEIRIDREDETWAGTLSVNGDDGKVRSRMLRGATCARVEQALALLTAIAIELGGKLEDSEPIVAPATPIVRRATNPPVRPPPLRLAPAKTFAWAFALAVGARGALATSLRPALEAGATLEPVRRAVLRPTATLSFFLATSLQSAAGDQVAQLWLLGARLETCPVALETRHVILAGCVAFEAGSVVASSYAARATPWLAVDPGLRSELAISSKSFLFLAASVLFPVFHTRYYFEPNETLFSTLAATGRMMIGVGFRL
jgi:hypothetical protein